MKVNYSKFFFKHFKERVSSDSKLRFQFFKRVRIFKENSSDAALKDHGLTGKMGLFRAFSITGDIRVVYKVFDGQIVFFDIGTHDQVY